MRAVALLGLVLAGCSGHRPPGPPVPLASVVLHDVQGFHGGHALWAAGDRTAVLQVVRGDHPGHAGLWEHRYRLTLTPEQWAEVERLVGSHHLMSVRPPTRPAVPDEGHPIIVVTTWDGRTARATKWERDRHPDFDPVYGYLLGLCRPVGEPVHEGPFDWDWRPDGFAEPWGS